MSWPASFYYKNTEKTVQHFSNHQTSLGMSVERLVNDLPYWRDLAPEVVEKKKTLVITDPTLTLEPGSADTKHRTEFAKMVEQLLADGFTIYVLGQDTLQPVTHAAQVHNLPPIPLLSAEEIRQTVKDAHLVADETEFLDYFATRQSHVLNLRDFWGLSAEATAELLDILTDSPNFQGIKIETAVGDEPDSLGQLMKQIAAIIHDKKDRQLFNIKEVTFSERSAAVLFARKEPPEVYFEALFDALLEAGCQLDVLQVFCFGHVRTLHGFFTEERVRKYQGLIENITYFSPDLINPKEIKDISFFNDPLKSLNFLHADPAYESLDMQYAFLKKAQPYLQSLVISAGMMQAFYRSKSGEAILPFEQLTTVNFSGGMRSRSQDSNASAFSHMPNLENIIFSGIDIARSSGYAENIFCELLDSGVQPKSLTLNKYFQLLNLEILKDLTPAQWKNTFSKLESLDLSLAMIPAEILLKILENSPNLKLITMFRSSVTGKNDKENLSEQALDALNRYPVFKKLAYKETLAERNRMMAAAMGGKATGTFDKELHKTPEEKRVLQRQIFEPLFSAPKTGPSSDRLRVFEKIIPDESENRLYYEQHEDLKLAAVGIEMLDSEQAFQNYLQGKVELQDADSYYGCVDLSLNAGEPVLLPSRSGNEALSALYFAGAKDADIKIEYSPVTHFYYLTANKSCVVTANFVVDVPKEVVHETFINEKDVLEIQKMYQQTEGDLSIDQYGASAAETIATVKKEHRGRCDLRSIAFAQEVNEKYPQLQCQLIGSDSHMYMELITADNKVLTLDAGGVAVDVTEELHSKRIDANQMLVVAAPSIPVDKPQVPVTVTTIRLTKPAAVVQALDPSVYNITGFTTHIKPIITNAEQLFNEYAAIANNPGKNYRIVSDIKTLPTLSNALHNQGKETHGKSFFFIDKPEQIRCLGRHATFSGDGLEGKVTKGLGGPLYDFLISDAKNKCIVIDYSHFTDEEMVQYNNILDQRVVDGVALNDTTVIGLCTPENYAEDDFTSRFNDESFVSLHERALVQTEVADIGEKSIDNKAVIELYDDAQQWESILLGRWQLEGDNLIFKPGELLQAIDQKKTSIVLKNAPWSDPGFKAFLDRLNINHVFNINGREYELSETVKVYKDSGYNWGQMLGSHTWQVKTDASAVKYDFVLNPNSQGYLLSDYRFENKKIYPEDGFIKKNAGKTLTFYVNRTIKPDAIAHILAEAKKHGVTINFHLAPQVQMPAEIIVAKDTEKRLRFNPFGKESPEGGKATVIYSTDVELTAQFMREKFNPDLNVDVSGLDANELFIKSKGEYQEDGAGGGHFIFEKDTCGIWQALLDGKTVLLKGSLSKELEDALLPLCLTPGFLYQNGEAINYPGKLIIVNNNVDRLTSIPRSSHQVSTQEKLNALPADEKILIANKLGGNAKKYNFLQLNTLTQFLKANSSAAPDEHWQGLLDLPTSHAKDFSPQNLIFDLDLKISDACTEKRRTLINEKLAYSPYVFIAGETGVGKSTFIHKEFKDSPNVSYHEGIENILAWAKDTSGKATVLFLDEADIGNEHWHLFKDLLKIPPSIYIQGQYIPLNEHHKVIFAGNPLSYGGERILPDLFAQGGGSVTFEPLPPAYLYHHILKPLLLEAGLGEEHSQEISTCFLTAYQKTLHAVPGKITITPRDLQMMCLLFLSHRSEQTNDLTLANNCADWVTKNALLKPANPITNEPVKITPTEDFAFTPGHEHAVRHMQGMLRVQQFKSNLDEGKSAKTTPGINLFILEGVSGIGKTTVIREALKQAGYGEEPLDATKDNATVRGYYLTPAGSDPKVKEELLIKAAIEGHPVVIDEINTGLRMEKLLNGLLMGHAPPDKDGKARKVHPDFIVFGTQNSVDKKGRKVASLAVQKRAVKFLLPDYNAKQIQDALLTKKCPAIIAQHLGVVYENRYKYAGMEKFNLRELINLTKDYLEDKPKAETISRLAYLHPECFEFILKEGKFDKFAKENPVLARNIAAYYVNNPKTSNELVVLIKQHGLHEIDFAAVQSILDLEKNIFPRINTLNNEEIYQVFIKMQTFKNELLSMPRSKPLIHRTQWFHGKTHWDEIIGDLKKQMIVNIQGSKDLSEVHATEKLKPVLDTHTSSTGRVLNYFGYRTKNGEILDAAITQKSADKNVDISQGFQPPTAS